MGDMAEQFVTLGAVILGAVLSFVAATFAERSRWRREQLSRWDERRLEAYESYADLVKRVAITASRIAFDGPLHATAPRAATAEELSSITNLELERTAAWERVLLLGDTATITAARIWHSRTWLLEAYARGSMTGSREDFSTEFRSVTQARYEFYAAARHSLGVRGGPVPDLRTPHEWGELPSRQALNL